MNLFTLLAAIAYVFAILYAKGWLVTASFANAVALVAAGLLLTLLTGAALTAYNLTRRPPNQ